MAGTVTPLVDVLPLKEIQKAAGHIQDAIREHTEKLQELEGFAKDNKSLHKLIQDLPNNVSYNIMVPFGKAAFFPGQLVHTNEMMVLLGEGYFAQRSVKQTVDILKRRGDFLNSNIGSLKAQLADLQAEASFATNAADEAAAGMVEIREEYVEPAVEQSAPTPLAVSKSQPDEEHDRIMARLAELEAEEEATGSVDDESDVEIHEAYDEEEEEEDEDENMYSSDSDVEGGLGNDAETSLIGHPVQNMSQVAEPPSTSSKRDQDVAPVVRSPADLMKFEEWKKRKWELGKSKQQESRKDAQQEDKKEAKRIDKPKRVTFNLPPEHKRVIPLAPENQPDVASEEEVQERFHREKAFTGSIVEHTPQQIQALDSKVLEDKPAKPVSRFKMQRLAA